MAKELVYNATIAEREDLTPALAVFRVRPDEGFPGDGSWFTPGQYLTLGLNNEVKPELGSVRRPMSIASAPKRATSSSSTSATSTSPSRTTR